ncbi:hypothetical protein [Pseudoxanthomonas wuyuanensis]|nr:hypothetical protein [Pseudoxanthomonas wuyuanensis]
MYRPPYWPLGQETKPPLRWLFFARHLHILPLACGKAPSLLSAVDKTRWEKEMNELLSGGMGILGIVIFVFLLALAILWFLLPFAIFGTKDKLNALIAESRQINAELARVTAELQATRALIATPRAVAAAPLPGERPIL